MFHNNTASLSYSDSERRTNNSLSAVICSVVRRRYSVRQYVVAIDSLVVAYTPATDRNSINIRHCVTDRRRDVRCRISDSLRLCAVCSGPN